MISVTAIKDSFDPKCPISPAVTHFFLEETRENGERQYTTHSSRRGRESHKEHSKSLRRVSEPTNIVDSVLNGLKMTTLDFTINPNIYSETYRIMGKPDFAFHTFDSAKVVELKKRHYPSKYGWLDKLQVELYMLILGDESFKAIPQSLEKDLRKKRIEGYVLYGNGKLVKVEPKNGDLTRLKVSETVEMINNYSSVYDLPKPKQCNPACSNIKYCAKKGLMPYENIFASPGGIKIESPFHSQRA